MTIAAPGWGLRGLAFVAGLAIVALGLSSWRLSSGQVVPGVDLSITATPTGELEMPQSGTVVEAHDLKPGTTRASAAGTLAIRNQTGTGLAVRLRAVPSSTDLDHLLMMKVTAGSTVVEQGTLGELRKWSRDPLLLSRGQQQTLHVQAWLPDSVRQGYQGRIGEISLVFKSTPVGS